MHEGETARFSVVVGGTPGRVEFLVDGRPLEADGKRILRVDDDTTGEHTITITDATLADAGRVTANVSNAAGSARSQVNFGVERRLEEPRFERGLEPLEVVEGETATASVEVAGEPTPKVQFLRNNEPIAVDGVHIVTRIDGDRRHSLTINEATLADAGTLTARASSPAGEATTSASLTVVEDLRAPHFVEPLVERQVQVGETCRLECKVEGKPSPQVEWRKDGAPAPIDGLHLVATADTAGVHSLTIHNARAEDAAAYEARATNKAGDDTTSAELKLEFAQETLAAATETAPTAAKPAAAPIFERPLEPTTVQEGESATLTCKVNADANLTGARWFIDDRQLAPDENISIDRRDDGTLRLMISRARAEHVGVVRCEAISEAGSAKTEAPLQLKYATIESVPTSNGDEGEVFIIGFARTLANKTASLGTTTTLECQLDAQTAELRDLEVRWTKGNNREPISYANSRVERLADGVLRLTLNEISVNDALLYRCTISHHQSSVWTEAALTITGAKSARSSVFFSLIGKRTQNEIATHDFYTHKNTRIFISQSPKTLTLARYAL